MRPGLKKPLSGFTSFPPRFQIIIIWAEENRTVKARRGLGHQGQQAGRRRTRAPASAEALSRVETVRGIGEIVDGKPSCLLENDVLFC